MPCTGRVVWRRPFAARGGQAAFGQVLLRAVEHAPQVAAVVVMAARHQDLRFRDGRGPVLVVLQRQRSAGEHFRFPGVQRDGAHGIAGFLRTVEAMQDFVSAFDDVSGHVALVRHTHVGHGVAADKAIAANEAEHPGQHLIAAGAVMGVQQDDFVGLAAVDLADVAQPDHVLGVVAAVVVAHAGLRHHERLEAFPAQFLQHSRGGDVAVPLGAAFVRGVRENGRGHGADLFIRQGIVGTQHRRTGSETGCELHGLSPDEKRFAVHTAHRIPRFGAQPFGCSVRSARGTRLALLPPSFLSSSPATVRSARTGAVKETSAGLVRPAGAPRTRPCAP